MLQVLHNNEKDQFYKLFQRDKVDKFEERFSILKVFLQTEKHITLSELSKLLADQKIVVKPELVSNTMKLMCEYGFARKHQFENGDIKYEHMHLGQHHDHMLCVKCNKIFEFKNEDLEQLQLKIALTHNFYVLQHRMELYGICYNCMAEREEISSLANASTGECLVITGFSGGKKFISRLTSIGLRVGDEVEIIVNSGKGQLVISLGHKRLVLCREFAKKLFVRVKINFNFL